MKPKCLNPRLSPITRLYKSRRVSRVNYVPARFVRFGLFRASRVKEAVGKTTLENRPAPLKPDTRGPRPDLSAGILTRAAIDLLGARAFGTDAGRDGQETPLPRHCRGAGGRRLSCVSTVKRLEFLRKREGVGLTDYVNWLNI